MHHHAAYSDQVLTSFLVTGPQLNGCLVHGYYLPYYDFIL
jgi:hypothetical protein